MSTNEITTRAAAPIAERIKTAQFLASAEDLIPAGFRGRDGKANPAKILFAVERAEKMNVSPFDVMNGYDFIDGKPRLNNDFMVELAENAGYHVETVESTDQRAIVRITSPKGEVHEVEWTMEKARRAGLAGKQMWQKWPANMLLSRANTDAVRTWARPALHGITQTVAEALEEAEAQSDDTRAFPPGDPRGKPESSTAYDETEEAEPEAEPAPATEPPAVLAAARDWVARIDAAIEPLTEYEDKRKALLAIDKEAKEAGESKLNVGPGMTVAGYIRELNAQLKEKAYGPRGTVEESEPEPPHEQIVGGEN